MARDRPRPSDEVKTYEPDNSLRRGYLRLVGDVARELYASRWLTYQLFKRDLLAFYKQSLLGAVWLVLVPLVTVGTFVVLRGSGVMDAGEVHAPYSIFAGLGVAVWTLFSQGLVAGSRSLVQGGQLISRINFSKKSLVIAAMGKPLVSFVVLVVLVIGLFLYHQANGYAYQPTAMIAWVPLALVPIMLLTLGLSFMLAIINAIIRDVATVIGVVITFVMLLTPVLYERTPVAAATGSTSRLLAQVTEYNPLYYLVAAPRGLILRGELVDAFGFWVSTAFSAVVFFLAIIAFHLTEPRIAERI
jgi:homopolymeric O-antigen transport system permease protein